MFTPEQLAELHRLWLEHDAIALGHLAAHLYDGAAVVITVTAHPGIASVDVEVTRQDNTSEGWGA